MKSTQVAIGSGSLRNPSKLQSAAPSPTAIAEKAYELWLAQGQEPGRDQEHWFEAERQLRHGLSSPFIGQRKEAEGGSQPPPFTSLAG
jgi:hypothetical protein